MIQITITAAVSVDGYIARDDGLTDWVVDDDLYEKICKEYGAICMGQITFEEYGGPAFEGIQHIVLSTKPHEEEYGNVHYADSVQTVISKAEQLGFNKLLVIGGAKTNQSFWEAGVVSELLLDTHRLVLGTGKKLFGDTTKTAKLTLVSSKQYKEGFEHTVYKVEEQRG